MAIRTPIQYVESLRDDRTVYYLGEKVTDVTRHEFIKICINWMAMDYVIENDPRYQELVTEKDDNGNLIPYLFTVQRNAEGLLRLREIVKLSARICLGMPSAAKFVGRDGLNAVTVVARKIDNKYSTDYTGRVESYRKYLQQNDLSIALAMTDVKGDRSLRPSKQKPHQDYYLRIVEERVDGIVVRGAKTHISDSPVSNELLVMPCRAMQEDDRDYAVCFAIPANTKGITFICTEAETKEPGNFFDYPLSSSIYINDALVVFNDVFVPRERIFMQKEWPFSGDAAYMFGNFHRLNAEKYKALELEILAGAAILMARYNGLEKVSHIQDKIAWLIQYCEAVEILGRSACEHCVTEPDLDLVYPNPMIANISKLYFADNWHQATKYAQDIAGGIVATVPSAKDYFNPETHSILEKYFGGKFGIPTEHRLKTVKLIKDLTSTYQDVLAIHAEGSLAAQKLSIFSLADFARYEAAAKRAARIDDGTTHPVYSGLPEFPARILE